MGGLMGRPMRHRQPKLGVHLWRTRTGYWYRVDHIGTHPLGKHPYLGAHDLRDEGPETPATSDEQATAPASPLEQHLADLITAHRAG
jgi:hypothetical protein